ncbi:hypothetical protein CDL15_Pgr024647 [Punica granatum]|uniref:Uncharacterized protein n=1 Tax=Punica granatum TaxID=22663 RepID=A0A218WVB6_PUNGR|nr:hypothetical protein CDL15_Pgr024647 [Punica granatum]
MTSPEGRSETCSMVLVVLGCAQACFRVPFPWIGPPGSPVKKGVYESSGVPRLRQEASKMCSEAPWAFRLPKRSFSQWRHFLEGLTPPQFLWAARWNPGGPMITGCPGVIGVPLLSHLGSTLIFPSQVVRQLGSLQDVPVEADRLPFRLQWADSSSMASARFLQIREIRRVWDTHVLQDLYFPKHPADEERAFSATVAYVAQFYALDSRPERRA